MMSKLCVLGLVTAAPFMPFAEFNAEPSKDERIYWKFEEKVSSIVSNSLLIFQENGMTGLVKLVDGQDKYNVDIDVNVDEHDCVIGHVTGWLQIRFYFANVYDFQVIFSRL